MDLKHQELYLQARISYLERKKWETEDEGELKSINDEIKVKTRELSDIRMTLLYKKGVY